MEGPRRPVSKTAALASTAVAVDVWGATAVSAATRRECCACWTSRRRWRPSPCWKRSASCAATARRGRPSSCAELEVESGCCAPSPRSPPAPPAIARLYRFRAHVLAMPRGPRPVPLLNRPTRVLVHQGTPSTPTRRWALPAPNHPLEAAPHQLRRETRMQHRSGVSARERAPPQAQLHPTQTHGGAAPRVSLTIAAPQNSHSRQTRLSSSTRSPLVADELGPEGLHEGGGADPS